MLAYRTFFVKLIYRVWYARDAPVFTDRVERSAEDAEGSAGDGRSCLAGSDAARRGGIAGRCAGR